MWQNIWKIKGYDFYQIFPIVLTCLDNQKRSIHSADVIVIKAETKLNEKKQDYTWGGNWGVKTVFLRVLSCTSDVSIVKYVVPLRALRAYFKVL